MSGAAAMVRAGFLARHGLSASQLAPLAGDASARRYWRLPGSGLLLMEDRHDRAGFAGFVQLSLHLNALGLSAPVVRAADPALGLALIEDFGTATYAARLAGGGDETALYALAVDALLHLHHHAGATTIDRPDYNLAIWLDELDIFAQWFAPAISPALNVDRFAARWRALWMPALAPLAHRHEALVLRDFHIDNLIELDGREGIARCGLLDFQDAVLGPAEYDLVSLLQDARRDLAPGLEAAMLRRYCAGAPDASGGAAAISARYALAGAQRHARIAGVFLRLARRDGKPRYLRFLPRVLGQFRAALGAARLQDIAGFLDDSLPDWHRCGTTPATSWPARDLPWDSI